MDFIKSFLLSFRALTLVDFIFFIAMITLIVLIVTLLYFVKINKEENVKEIEEIVDDNENAPITIESNVISEDEEGELLDLASITKALEERKSNPIEMTEYEQEQEDRAIISYEELLEKSHNLALNYEEDENISDLAIKKVDLGNLVNETAEEVKPKFEVRVISYQKEEAFLEALKKLKEQIN